jgi:arginase
MHSLPCLIGVPFDAASSYLRGAANAPGAIRRALRSPSSNGWSESIRDILTPDALLDAGDLDIASEDWLSAITEGVRKVLSDGHRPLVLGGDHSISHPVLRAIREVHPQLTILHLDAHADLYEEFEGDRHSHACPFARVMEERDSDRLVQAGIRTLNEHQRQQAARYRVTQLDMRDWVAGARPVVDGPVHLSLDMDVMDPAFAPGVSHWEPGGLTVREVITLVQQLGGTLVGADLVEYNPTRDPTGMTAMVAAKLVKEIASRMLDDAA